MQTDTFAVPLYKYEQLAFLFCQHNICIFENRLNLPTQILVEMVDLQNNTDKCFMYHLINTIFPMIAITLIKVIKVVHGLVDTAASV